MAISVRVLVLGAILTLLSISGAACGGKGEEVRQLAAEQLESAAKKLSGDATGPPPTIKQPTTPEAQRRGAPETELRLGTPKPTNVLQVPGHPFQPTPTSPFVLQELTPDVEILGIEVTQGIQNLDNDMPLVGDSSQSRLTYARVYIRAMNTPFDGSISNVYALMCGFRGSDLVGDCILPENAPVTANADGGNRLEVDDSFLFFLPIDYRWGTVTLAVSILAVGVGADTHQVTVSYSGADPLNMVSIPMHLHSGYTSGGSEITYFWQSDTIRAHSNMLRLHPIAARNGWIYSTFQLEPQDHDDGEEWVLTTGTDNDWDLDEWGDMLDAIRDFRMNTTDWATDLHYYGMVPDLPGVGGYGSGSTPTAWGEIKTTPRNNAPWHIRGGRIMAHEMGHNEGLDHVLCSGSEGDNDQTFPWLTPTPALTPAPFPTPACSLSQVDPDGFYGFDVYWRSWSDLTGPEVISNNPGEPSPHNNQIAFPMMSYRKASWIDPYHYCKLLNAYGVECTLFGISP